MKSNLLADKKGIIFGAVDERSIAWHVAERCAEAGAQSVITNTKEAFALGNMRELCEKRGWPVIECDATSVDDIHHLLDEAQSIMGGKVDFMLHSVAQSMNLRRHLEYENDNYNYFLKTIDISALSLHKLLSEAMKMDAISEWGSVVTLTFLASQRYVLGYNDMGDAKAMLESIVRQMGALYGNLRRVRINAISQSVTKTKAGSQWRSTGEFFYKYTNDLSPLGNASADDCADLCVALFSDLTRKLTMQTIYNDGGFGRTMLTPQLMDSYKDTFHPTDKDV